MRYNILGVGFDDCSLSQAADAAAALMEAGRRGYVATPNPEIVCLCQKDPDALAVVNGAALVLPDGIGIVYASRLLGYPIKTRVPGIEFAGALMDRMAAAGKKLFLLGAKPGVAAQAAENLARSHPGLIVCGTHDGYFRDDGPVVEEINRSGADAVFVCLGAPKQELWMAKNGQVVRAPLMAGLGGSLDVFAGKVRRAPEVWQKLGLEWLYRALSDRGRFLRVLKLPVFLFKVIGMRLRRGRKHD